ncbi:MAG: acetoacetate--CoA ligase [Actinobacteria bacterium]|nr:acetoacetate--CoA ligase [Actinomycetota bacterium]
MPTRDPGGESGPPASGTSDQLEDAAFGRTVWEPPGDVFATSRMGRFLTWVAERGGGDHSTYDDAWRWSVEDPAAFWGAVRDHFGLPIQGERCIFEPGHETPTGLPGARWFPGAKLNAATIMLAAAGRPDDAIAIRSRSDTRDDTTSTFGELRAEVARVRRGLYDLGVRAGDRVALYAPNITETIIAFLATASLGAVWTSCAPEFGTRSVLDRLTQIRPKILIAVDGYRYGARTVTRHAERDEIIGHLDSLEAVVTIPYLDPEAPTPPGSTGWADLDGPVDPGPLEVAFDHPLWVLYSSGTTGLPKAIVHSHGGITLEHHKALALQSDIGPSDRFFWFTTTGWMMWNYLVSGLSVGASLALFDGDPGADDMHALWRWAEDAGVTAFGVSAPFLDACRRRGLRPRDDHDLSKIRWVGSTGAPLGAASYVWIAQQVGPVPISSISGGTDVCTAFVGGAPLLPVHAGKIPCRFLGADVHAFGPDGSEVIGVEGELVVTTPMPSMPIGFWDDPDRSRLHAAYFERYPGVWHHGDWITITGDGECVISGRSDATLNRGGVRLGTADFYSVIGEVDGIRDCLVIHLDAGTRDELVAFVALDDDRHLDDALRSVIRDHLRAQLSPRHVPDEIVQVPAIPVTLSGKKTEVPIKRILMGIDPTTALTTGALANPEAIDAFVAWGRSHRGADHTLET